MLGNGRERLGGALERGNAPAWMGQGVDLLGFCLVAGARNHRELTPLIAGV